MENGRHAEVGKADGLVDDNQVGLIAQAQQDEVDVKERRRKKAQYRVVVLALALILLIPVFAFVLKFLQARADKMEEIPPIRRLQSSVQPSLYKVELNADEKRNHITGKVAVNLDITEVLTQLDIHAVEGQKLSAIVLKETYLNGDHYVDNTVVRQVYDNPQDIYEIHFQKKFGPCKAELVFEFSGNISTGVTGLFKTKYNPFPGLPQTRYLLATQFEATHARAAFPCFDEPSLKAMFKFRLRFPQENGFKVLFRFAPPCPPPSLTRAPPPACPSNRVSPSRSQTRGLTTVESFRPRHGTVGISKSPPR